MSNPNYNTLATTTIEARTRQTADNITDNSALLYRMRRRGKPDPVSGGRIILQELDYLDTPNTGWYSGLDTLTTVATDTATAAQYDIKEAYASMVISGLEMAQNRSREAMISLLRYRIDNMERSMMNLINIGVYSDGTAATGKQIGGLQLLVPLVNTNTVGNINRTSATWWRNIAQRSSVNFGGAATSATILNHMGRVYNQLVRGTDVPDLVPSDSIAYQLFMDALSDRQVIMNVEMGEAGFINAKFRNADVVLDGGVDGACPANSMYFLNTRFFHWRPMSGMDVYQIGGDVVPTTGLNSVDALVRRIGWKGNLTLSNSRLQGLLRTD